MLSVNSNVVHASEFLEYLDIVRSHRLAIDSKSEELFVDEHFTNKEKCIFTIKWYSMKMSVEYKFAVTHYILEKVKPWSLLKTFDLPLHRPLPNDKISRSSTLLTERKSRLLCSTCVTAAAVGLFMTKPPSMAEHGVFPR